jgi:DNA invertase Pin-like site-specific DNA recombinase
MEWEITKEYVDRASGADQNRQSFAELMKAAKHHEFDIILCVRLDRITRSLSNLLSSIEDLDRWNIRLVCTDQMIETGNATGKLLIHLLGALAEFERELIRDRINDGLVRAKAEGKTLGRPLSIVDALRIHELRLEGMSYRKIAVELNSSDATVRRRAKMEPPLPLNIKEAKND